MATQSEVIENPRTGQRMKFVLTSQDTNGELLRIDCTNPPNGVREPEHIHPIQESRFEIRAGSLMVCVAGQEREVRAGETLSIPPRVPHFFWNGGDQAVHYIQEFRPALRSEQFFRTLFDLAREGKINDQGGANLLQMAVVVPQVWNEIRVIHPPALVQRVLFGILGPIGRLLGYRGIEQ